MCEDITTLTYAKPISDEQWRPVERAENKLRVLTVALVLTVSQSGCEHPDLEEIILTTPRIKYIFNLIV